MNAELSATLATHKLQQKHTGSNAPVFTNPATGKPWHDIRKRLRKSLDAAKIFRHFPIKNLRQTFAGNRVMAGWDLRSVAQLLGHKSTEMTHRYAHLSPDHLKDVVDFKYGEGERARAPKKA